MTARITIKNGNYYGLINYKSDGKYKTKWVSLGIPAKNNKRKAEQKLEDVKAEFEKSLTKRPRISDNGSPSGTVLFTDYIRKWLRMKRDTVQLCTWEGYMVSAEKHIIPYFEPLRLKITDVKPFHIKEYYTHKYTTGRLDGKPGGLSIKSIKSHAIVIKEVLDDAVMEELIQKNPANGIRMPAKNVPSQKKTFLTAEEANVLLRAFVGHPLQGLVYTTLYYGLRRSEALGLRWSAIDFKNNTMTINHTVVKNLTIVEKDSVKTQSSYHEYMLIDDVRNVLLAQLEKRKKMATEFGRGFNDSDYVFTWDDGTLFRPDYVTRSFQRVLKRNGLPRMRFHDLRHSTASVLYDKGWSIKDIQSWLRHSSIEVTSDIYTHISEDRKSKMASELNSTFILK